jgi:hypothetical protein
MDTSGTGHAGARLSSPAHQAPGTPPHGGDTKISKRRYGFVAKKIFGLGRTEAVRELRNSRQNRGAAPFFKGLPGDLRLTCQSLPDNALHPLLLRCLWRSLAIPETGWNQRRSRAFFLPSRLISFIRFWLFFSVICKLYQPAANEVLSRHCAKDLACRITQNTPPP